jgi:putative transposase
MDAKAEKLALFRYGLIASLVIEKLPRGELSRRAEEIASRHYDIPCSKRHVVSVDTLLDWASRYRNGGFEALAPKPRQDRGQSRTINPQLASLIERLKRENPHRTGTTLLRELALSSGNDESPVSASTLYRFLKQRGLSEKQLLAPPAHKKFEAEFGNQIWQADMLFGPWVERPDGGRRQVFLHATLDDASRLVPHAQFYSSQALDAVLDCLRQAIAARGIPIRLYIDNARMYQSPQLSRIAASLGTLIVHSRPYQPEGRGKIERFFRTVREQFIANLDPKHTLTLAQLNDRLWAWVENSYHDSEHSALGTTPLLRWQRDIEQVRQSHPRPICTVSFSIVLTAWCGVTRLSCCTGVSMKLRLIWPARPSRSALIRSMPLRWRSGFRANSKLPRDRSIRWPTASCHHQSQRLRPNPSRRASTSSNC